MASNREFYVNQYQSDRQLQAATGLPMSGSLRVPDWLQRERALWHVTGDWQSVPDEETEAEVSSGVS